MLYHTRVINKAPTIRLGKKLTTLPMNFDLSSNRRFHRRLDSSVATTRTTLFVFADQIKKRKRNTKAVKYYPVRACFHEEIATLCSVQFILYNTLILPPAIHSSTYFGNLEHISISIVFE